jgi:hypothetical protein
MSRGGSRYGAGRPGWHAKTSGKHCIDVRRLHRDGNLDIERCVTLQWSDGATIDMTTSPNAVTLIYRYKDCYGEWRDVNQCVSIDRTPCNYGNARPWFSCPRCWRRVAILYLWNIPLCRKCARLAYPSQSDDALGRSWRRTSKVECKLAAGADKWNYRRPRGMREVTYRKLVEAYWREEEWREAEIMLVWERLASYF